MNLPQSAQRHREWLRKSEMKPRSSRRARSKGEELPGCQLRSGIGDGISFELRALRELRGGGVYPCISAVKVLIP